jgi:hypothetical protein
MFLLLLGACSTKQPRVDPTTDIQCVPDIEVKTVIVPVPAELSQIWYNPAVPTSGSNVDLLNWAEACAVTTHLYQEQMKKLRELK